MKTLLFSFSIFLLFTFSASAQTTKTYVDSRGNEVVLPLGVLSFADKALMMKNGKPPSKGKHSDKNNALNEPDFKEDEDFSATSLGRGGELVLEFTNNSIVDMEGPDIYVFEVGSGIEPTHVFISKDLKDWIHLGKIGGGTTAIDIADKVEKDEAFYYIKLIDAMSSWYMGPTAGADIDAVAAIGSIDSEIVMNDKPTAQNSVKETFNVDSRKVTIKIWDNAKEDGDLVDVIFNDEVLVENQEVTVEGKVLELKLKKGKNVFELKALNIGEMSPNTAAILVDDGRTQYQTLLSSEAGNSQSIIITVD